VRISKANGHHVRKAARIIIIAPRDAQRQRREEAPAVEAASWERETR